LPWRARGRTVRLRVSQQGEIDPDELDRVLEKEGKLARLVSVTGASNVVGTIQPVKELTKVAHKHGVPIAIDAAQLGPHIPINMMGDDEETRIDFLFLSGHKMYAPFGGGVLVGPRDFFKRSAPTIRGGGAVLVVGEEGVDWSNPPDSEEAGSPNVIGAITLAAASRELRNIGFDTLIEHEEMLTKKLLTGLADIDGARVFGLTKSSDSNRRLGVVSFNLKGINDNLVATILSHEGGIGVRNGCFCAHPFVMQMLNISESTASGLRDKIRKGDRSEIPRAVRVSFGLYNTEDEVERLLYMIRLISEKKIETAYEQNSRSGHFYPVSGIPDYRSIIKELKSLNI